MVALVVVRAVREVVIMGFGCSPREYHHLKGGVPDCFPGGLGQNVWTWLHYLNN
jgi:hypothetical protein